jgi:phasin family protein
MIDGIWMEIRDIRALYMQSQLSRVSALNKSGLDAWLDAAQLMAEAAEKIGRLQLETFKSLLRESAERGRSLSELKGLAELPARAGGEAVANAEKVLGYTRNLYDTARTTGVQLFELTQARSGQLREDWFSALDDLTDAVPGGKTGGTKAALDSTRTTVEAVIEGLTRTAKQSIELSDAVVKTTSDSAVQAFRSLATRG